jgi:hypothetical protein
LCPNATFSIKLICLIFFVLWSLKGYFLLNIVRPELVLPMPINCIAVSFRTRAVTTAKYSVLVKSTNRGN